MPFKRNDTLWNKRLEELKRYKETHGNCDVPRRYAQNPKLANWVQTQRTQCNLLLKGGSSYLTKERIDQLNEIDFDWCVKVVRNNILQVGTLERTLERIDHLNEIDISSKVGTVTNDALWKERYAELVDFKQEHGHCCVPTTYILNRRLGKWVDTQRRQYKIWKTEGESNLTKERRDKLNKIGFVWQAGKGGHGLPIDRLWKIRVKELKEFKKENKHCRVPKRYPQNKALARWVQNQRMAFKKWQKKEKSSLTDERVDELKKIDFVWEVKPKSKESNKSVQESVIPSIGHRNTTSVANKS